MHLHPATAFMMLFTIAAGAQAEMTLEEISAAAARIDAAVDTTLAKQSDTSVNRWAQPTPTTRPVTDADFLRRITVDLAGRLPTSKEARAFAADPSPGKRSAIIDHLLQTPAAGGWRFQRLADTLRVTDDVLGVSQARYIDWLRRACAEDEPYDHLVNTLLTAHGTLAENPAAGLLLRDYGLIQVTTAELARAFLGEDIHCATCHDHPFTNQTQRGFYEFAACFNVVHARSPTDPPQSARAKPLLPGARALPHRPIPPDASAQDVMPKNPDAAFFRRLELTEMAAPLAYPANYNYRNARPGDLVDPRYLPENLPMDDPRSAFAESPSRLKLRDQVAAWFTSRERGSFTAIAAIRVWDWMFGVPGRPIEDRAEAGFSAPPAAARPLGWQGLWPEDHLQLRAMAGFAPGIRHRPQPGVRKLRLPHRRISAHPRPHPRLPARGAAAGWPRPDPSPACPAGSPLAAGSRMGRSGVLAASGPAP